MEYDEALEVLKTHAENMMNKDRQHKVLILLDMISDVIFEDELTKGFFKYVRGEV